MLVLSESIEGRKVMSIHAGGPIAKLSSAVVEPTSLKIVGFSVRAPGIRFFSILHSSDLREWGALGVVVNSEDSIMEVDENMPKIRKIIESKFKLAGTGVRTESGRRLGRVVNFVFETEGYFVVKLYVERVGILSLTKKPLIIERSSITNVTNKFIEVKEASIEVEKQKKKEIEYGFEA